tara:strand:+ start:113 stop:289 length:177 start_codon:yes stop_codon:yes gene_type:complete
LAWALRPLRRSPLAASVATTVSSSSWLEQQQLAEALEEQLTGVEAIEVSTTVHESRSM